MKQSLRSPALYKAVRDYIKEYILQNDLKPGDSLPNEGQLVEDLGVGRSSVREAVKSLQSLGIIEVRQGEGLYVRELNFDPILETFKFGIQFNPQTLAELLQIRIWLEMAVIGDAVKQIGSAELLQLDQIINTWEVRIQNAQKYYDLDEDFHRILYSVLNNHTLMKLFDAFWFAFMSLEIAAIQESDPIEELDSHRDLLEAVKSGDTDLTRKELQVHFDHVKERIQRYLNSTES